MNFFRPKPPISTINGLTLPPHLAEMVKAKRWKRPADTRRLAELTGIKDVDRLEFLKPERMATETATLISLFEQGFGEMYGLARSEEGKKISDKTKADLRWLISIMVNDDEEGVALDYRPGVDRPRVVAGTWPNGEDEKMQWRVIANDFETFAEKIGVTLSLS